MYIINLSTSVSNGALEAIAYTETDLIVDIVKEAIETGQVTVSAGDTLLVIEGDYWWKVQVGDVETHSSVAIEFNGLVRKARI